MSDEDVEALPLAIAADSPLNELIRRERSEAVRQAVLRLPEKFRVPLTLRYYGELSYDEIAEQLGFTRANVATLVFRAKQELRIRLAKSRGVWKVRPSPARPRATTEPRSGLPWKMISPWSGV